MIRRFPIVWGPKISRVASRQSIRLAVTVAAFGASLPAGAEAQSLLAREGLGITVEPIQARARAMGSPGIGLSGWYASEVDPAAAAGMLLPSISGSFQPVTAELSDGRSAGHTRFPNVTMSYPLAGSVFSLHLGSFLDQEWQAILPVTLELGDDEVAATDRYDSSGGIGRVQASWSRMFGSGFAVGASFGSYLGSVEHVFTRVILDSGPLGDNVASFQTGTRLTSSGLVAGAGVIWDPSPLFRLSGSFLWSDDLTLAPTSETVDEKQSYTMPLELRAGGTFTLSEELGLHVGLTYADWTDAGEDLANGSSRGPTWSYGGGIEWGGGTLLDRALPLRLGARHRDLPFDVDGESAQERVLSAGLGIDLAGNVDETAGARAEFSLERGSRDGADLSETFWRTTVTLRLTSG